MTANAIKHLNDDLVEKIRAQLQMLKHPCHNQRVASHIELVTEATAYVAEHDQRDSMVWLKIT